MPCNLVAANVNSLFSVLCPVPRASKTVIHRMVE